MSAQRAMPPAAGFVQAVPDAEPYARFPGDTLGRLRWAEDATIGNLAAKATLIVLAHHADKADGKAWPATATLAGWLDVTPRGVRKALRSLARMGWLVSVPREGKSTLRWLKSPAEHLCRECFARFEREAIPCPSCGYTGDLLQPQVRNVVPGGRNVVPGGRNVVPGGRNVVPPEEAEKNQRRKKLCRDEGLDGSGKL